MTTRARASNGDWQPGAAGVQRSYSYDTADRLTGSGVGYDSFGRMTSVPAAHSGGGVLSYTYHVDHQVRTISQDGGSKTYSLDPEAEQRLWPTRLKLKERTAQDGPVFGYGTRANSGRFRIGLGEHKNHEWFRISWGHKKDPRNHI